MNTIMNGWFSELSELWPGQSMSLEVEEVLYEGKSKFQDIIVFKSKTYGNVLILDGIIQCTERDEYSYHEMISFLPINSHPNPKNVLIIGGGDGGVIRECVKHPLVEKVTQCEIDEEVIAVSKKYLPTLSSGYNSPKLTLHIGDGFEFMAKHTQEFDVIITDSSDPVGPAEVLFEKPYYELMKKALRTPNGIICFQEGGEHLDVKDKTRRESLALHLPLVKRTMEMCKTIYPVVSYGYCTIPTYPSGQIGFILASLNPKTNFAEPVIKWADEEVEMLRLKYYNTAIHRAAFVHPQFTHKALGV